jgi:hypothetical protein
VGKIIHPEVFTHPMILLTQNHFPSQEGIKKAALKYRAAFLLI